VEDLKQRFFPSSAPRFLHRLKLESRRFGAGCELLQTYRLTYRSLTIGLSSDMARSAKTINTGNQSVCRAGTGPKENVIM
jgi:hypothetical protein